MVVDAVVCGGKQYSLHSCQHKDLQSFEDLDLMQGTDYRVKSHTTFLKISQPFWEYILEHCFLQHTLLLKSNVRDKTKPPKNILLLEIQWISSNEGTVSCSQKGFCFNLHVILYKNTQHRTVQNNYLKSVCKFYLIPLKCITENVLCQAVVMRMAEHCISVHTVHNIDQIFYLPTLWKSQPSLNS